MTNSTTRFQLRNLSLPTRLVLAAFLISVGLGYCSALVQMHFQHASSGKMLPDADDVIDVFHGRPGISQFERLLTADENRPFNGSGSMRQTFTTKSAGWKGAVKKRAKDKNLSLAAAETELRRERDGERLAILEWVRTGADQASFEGNSFVLPASLASHAISDEFLDSESAGQRAVKIGAIIESRCARCHDEGKGGGAGQVPLATWEQVHEYCQVESLNCAMPIKKLAQSTHVHLLSFAMLYGLTGVLVTFTSYPKWFRGILAPLPLVAQLADISCWWLARFDPLYARLIMFTGAVVALSLMLQIGLTLFNLFGKTGRIVLVALLLAGALGGYQIKIQIVDPYLAQEQIRVEFRALMKSFLSRKEILT